MKYVFRCSDCGNWRERDWADRDERRACPKCGWKAPAPDPEDDREAYVDQHDPPAEMENAVYYLKGLTCTAPGCDAVADGLDHRIPYVDGRPNGPGRTSVANLWPMCTKCNSSKGTRDYEDWCFEQ